ncbi:hypothetical protein GCM10010503_19430 [Streptomyces lucensis JCM 4490]|uniref:Uncharacterized protein n=1 Tax=Streptomyces lucensis JCM 4490 TaxID=1306176 RepID=A0A918MN99_9ACTN|nr:hypothetical protein GCM10010503_19430 [Streptomyces lucensis JCM 4490]
MRPPRPRGDHGCRQCAAHARAGFPENDFRFDCVTNLSGQHTQGCSFSVEPAERLGSPTGWSGASCHPGSATEPG